jgi:hypothetical protein
MSVLEFKQILWLLMLIPLGIVLGAGILFTISAVRWVRESKLRNQLGQLDFDSPVVLPHQPQRSRAFGYERPTVWLAIKANDPKKVLAALDLHDPMFCSWEEGLVESREHKLFISPPVAGWILVFGADLPDPGDDVDKCFHFLSNLSRQVGHLQFFTANRPLNHHGWAIVDRGQVFRAYAWAGQTLWYQGTITAAERELGMACFDYTARVDFTQREVVTANTEKVPQLAARWSVDPAAVSETAWARGQGIIGSFSPPKPH